MLVVGVTFVVGMHNDVFITKFGFRSGGADLEWTILEGVKFSLSLLCRRPRHRTRWFPGLDPS